MKRYGHGLVPGRFHPPHAGHHHLVRTARDRCERLTVLVRASAAESLPLDDRLAWMREIHPDVLVVGAVDDASDPEAPAAALRAAVPEPVDAVFTTEPSGAGLGRRLGAETVLGDRAIPLTDAAVRADPAGHWDLLEPPVRAALTRRIVVLGAESTGTTTMARALADHYRRRGGVWTRTRCVPDYARAYGALRLAELRAAHPAADPSDVTLRSSDFPVIAQRQAELEEEAARDGSPVLFCDTDAFAATIRHERYTGTTSPATGEIAAHGRQHLWLLTDHRGVTAEDAAPPDGEHLRPWMTARLLTQLSHTGRRTAVLTGPHEERLAAAVAAVDGLLAEGWHLTDTPPERR
ncbi:AAA family ATPase [Streptomyces tanashiensis]|uniref:AAA family ATPase n=1 Tax=Streptomyces tanashiensis TaxID=67367 RepID=A0ABY6R401_9ACTN|nr:AAA family ATPase [Streptomyces tanashiensis]UZX24770.1 AAA family ATPase [Streptomyces tanashiensis]